MIGTVVVYFVAELLEWNTVLAFLVSLMLSLALCLNLREVVLEALMLNLLIISLICETVWALMIGWMIATVLDLLDLLLGDS